MTHANGQKMARRLCSFGFLIFENIKCAVGVNGFFVDTTDFARPLYGGK
jgi:hypothetical protein